MSEQDNENQKLPPLYKSLEPLSFNRHGDLRYMNDDAIPHGAGQNAFPITIGEFGKVQRVLPIVFAHGDSPVPIALMGLETGKNVFIDADGKVSSDLTYIPAYLRRYPFLLARADSTDDLTLCIDKFSSKFTDAQVGAALFENGKPSNLTSNMLSLSKSVDEQNRQTAQFVELLQAEGLLMDGQIELALKDRKDPFVFRGFQIVNMDRLGELDAEKIKELSARGVLTLVHLHQVSLGLVPQILSRQISQGLEL